MSTVEPDNDKWVTFAEAARLVGMSWGTILEWTTAKKDPVRSKTCSGKHCVWLPDILARGIRKRGVPVGGKIWTCGNMVRVNFRAGR